MSYRSMEDDPLHYYNPIDVYYTVMHQCLIKRWPHQQNMHWNKKGLNIPMLVPWDSKFQNPKWNTATGGVKDL